MLLRGSLIKMAIIQTYVLKNLNLSAFFQTLMSLTELFLRKVNSNRELQQIKITININISYLKS